MQRFRGASAMRLYGPAPHLDVGDVAGARLPQSGFDSGPEPAAPDRAGCQRGVTHPQLLKAGGTGVRAIPHAAADGAVVVDCQQVPTIQVDSQTMAPVRGKLRRIDGPVLYVHVPAQP